MDALGGATGAGGLLSKEAREVSVVILGSRLLARFESGQVLPEGSDLSNKLFLLSSELFFLSVKLAVFCC